MGWLVGLWSASRVGLVHGDGVLGVIGGYGVVGWSLVCIEGGFGPRCNRPMVAPSLIMSGYKRRQNLVFSHNKLLYLAILEHNKLETIIFYS